MSRRGVLRLVRLDRNQVRRLLELVETDPKAATSLAPLQETLREAALRGEGVRILAQPENDAEEPVLSPPEVASLYGVSAQMVRRWCAEGKLPGAYKRPGGGWQIPLSALLEATHVPRPGRKPAGALAKIIGLLHDRPRLARELLEARRTESDRELPRW